MKIAVPTINGAKAKGNVFKTCGIVECNKTMCTTKFHGRLKYLKHCSSEIVVENIYFIFLFSTDSWP